MKRLLKALACAVSAFVLLTGCTAVESSDEEEVGTASLNQVMWSERDWIRYQFAFADDTTLADVLVMTNSVGDYRAQTEYWFIQSSGLQQLSTREYFTATHSEGDGTPPSLAGDQEFEQPVLLSWDHFATDPVSDGYLFDGENASLRIEVESGLISRLTWYQVIDQGERPANVMPLGRFTRIPGSVVVPGEGEGYYIDAEIE